MGHGGPMVENSTVEIRHRDLRNLLRRQMRWKREVYGEDLLRSMGDVAFLCYEDIDEFVRRFPTDFRQESYLESIRTQLAWTNRLAREAEPGIDRALGIGDDC